MDIRATVLLFCPFLSAGYTAGDSGEEGHEGQCKGATDASSGSSDMYQYAPLGLMDRKLWRVACSVAANRAEPIRAETEHELAR